MPVTCSGVSSIRCLPALSLDLRGPSAGAGNGARHFFCRSGAMDDVACRCCRDEHPRRYHAARGSACTPSGGARAGDTAPGRSANGARQANTMAATR